MKRIIAITVSAVLMLTLFAACGKKEEEMKDDVKDELTSMRDDVSDAIDDGKNDANNIADDLTENGNVTNQTGEGILNEAITDISEMFEGDNGDATTEKKDDTARSGQNQRNR